MTFEVVIICTGLFLLSSVKGELVADQTPCPGEQAMYRCTVSGGNLVWQWTPVGGQREDYIIPYLFPLQQSRIETRMIGDVAVVFNITEFIISSTITSVATVNNPELLNGTVMSCGGQSHTINVPGKSLVPTALRVFRTSDNESELVIQPAMERNTSGVFYQLSSSNTPILWTSPITVTPPESITFSHCRYNSTFTIDSCILQDASVDRNYTLYSNGTWSISRRCNSSEILVSCNDENWSEDLSCPEIDTTGSTISSVRSSAVSTVSSRTTDEGKSTTDTGTGTGMGGMNIMIWVGLVIGIVYPTSCDSNKYSLELVIGSVIGGFVLALLLGLVLGLLFGVKFTRTYNIKQVNNTSMIQIDLNKGPLYEEVEIEKNVELTQNISYETVKNMK